MYVKRSQKNNGGSLTIPSYRTGVVSRSTFGPTNSWVAELGRWVVLIIVGDQTCCYYVDLMCVIPTQHQEHADRNAYRHLWVWCDPREPTRTHEFVGTLKIPKILTLGTKKKYCISL